MNKFWKTRRRTILFTLGGGLMGLAYYYFIGCASGTCSITSHPLRSMVYMAVMGWLLSMLFEGKEETGCST